MIGVCAAVLVTAPSNAQAPDPVSISYEPVWQGLGGELTTVPIRLSLENTGKPETIGIRWMDGDTETATVIDLPSGAKKERVLYITKTNGYNPLQLLIRRGILETPLSVEPTSTGNFEATKIGIISDSLGDAALVKPDKEKQFENKRWSNGFAAGVAKPGMAPTRTSGYDDLGLLILGEGAERLTDAEVAAIQLSVLRGLHLVFVGGPIRPVLSDPRWQGFLPVSPGGSSKDVAPPSAYGVHSNVAPPTGPMLDLKPKPGAATIMAGQVAVQSTLPVGAGNVTWLAYDLFSTPWRTWNGRFSLIYSLAWEPCAEGWQPFLQTLNQPAEEYYGSPAMSVSTASGGTAKGLFGIKVPDAGRISLLLIGYLVLVVPVNFVLLRKLRKGELAWVTAPVIALGAAGVLFGFAGQLYSSAASRQTTGFLVGSDAGDGALFVGSQQIFFPGNGRYDLKLENVQKVGTSSYRDYNMFGQAQTQNHFVDMGSITAPSFTVDNLSFREFHFEQATTLPKGWLTVSESGGETQVQLRNPMATDLHDVTVEIGGVKQRVPKIGPGESVTVRLKVPAGGRRVGLASAQVDPSMYGGRFGEEVGKDTVRLLYSFTAGDSR